eukprot:TRINITY_DN9856_c0_g1_i1.p1 TRINITY_DN9856_c0_g1~~TRINITY_DN9856_c0_g1_i1.p1  ORF type:complete len:614 (-),score=90.40 TRINITY_DN9856_c0_g1_i1:42-1883(-)
MLCDIDQNTTFDELFQIASKFQHVNRSNWDLVFGGVLNENLSQLDEIVSECDVKILETPLRCLISNLLKCKLPCLVDESFMKESRPHTPEIRSSQVIDPSQLKRVTEVMKFFLSYSSDGEDNRGKKGKPNKADDEEMSILDFLKFEKEEEQQPKRKSPLRKRVAARASSYYPSFSPHHLSPLDGTSSRPLPRKRRDSPNYSTESHKDLTKQYSLGVVSTTKLIPKSTSKSDFMDLSDFLRTEPEVSSSRIHNVGLTSESQTSENKENTDDKDFNLMEFLTLDPGDVLSSSEPRKPTSKLTRNKSSNGSNNTVNNNVEHNAPFKIYNPSLLLTSDQKNDITLTYKYYSNSRSADHVNSDSQQKQVNPLTELTSKLIEAFFDVNENAKKLFKNEGKLSKSKSIIKMFSWICKTVQTESFEREIQEFVITHTIYGLTKSDFEQFSTVLCDKVAHCMKTNSDIDKENTNIGTSWNKLMKVILDNYQPISECYKKVILPGNFMSCTQNVWKKIYMTLSLNTLNVYRDQRMTRLKTSLPLTQVIQIDDCELEEPFPYGFIIKISAQQTVQTTTTSIATATVTTAVPSRILLSSKERSPNWIQSLKLRVAAHRKVKLSES